MATTAELVTILQEQFKGWNANGPRGVLHYIDVAHRIFRQVESEQTVYFDETNGKLPYLDTTDGVYKYSLPSNCWKLAGVYIEAGVTGSLLDNLSLADYGLRVSNVHKIESVVMSGIEYLRLHNVRSWPASEAAVARLAFSDNPGTTDDVYNIKYYRQPVELVSDSIQLEVEPPYDELYLLPAVCELIEGIQHGNYADARTKLLEIWRPKYWKEINGGEQGFDFDSEDRGY
jgi:hypothetical protein